MKLAIAICCLAAVLPSGHLAAAEPADHSAAAEAAIVAFGGALKAELTSAMQAGGPLNAIEVCHSRAPAIAEAVSLDSDMQLSRVSLRNRSPYNAPNEWQSAVLQAFEARLAAGESAAALTWEEVAETDDGKEFRLMKAIPTGAVCLACHGESIAPPVAEKIAELYPEDRATGFREGDIRGAFVVTKALN